MELASGPGGAPSGDASRAGGVWWVGPIDTARYRSPLDGVNGAFVVGIFCGSMEPTSAPVLPGGRVPARELVTVVPRFREVWVRSARLVCALHLPRRSSKRV